MLSMSFISTGLGSFETGVPEVVTLHLGHFICPLDSLCISDRQEKQKICPQDGRILGSSNSVIQTEQFSASLTASSNPAI